MVSRNKKDKQLKNSQNTESKHVDREKRKVKIKREQEEASDIEDDNTHLMGSAHDNFVLSQPKIDYSVNTNNDISIKGFSINTRGGKILFKDADLVLSYGHRYGLVGPNGRGKTTLLRHIGLKQFNVPPHLDILYVEQEVVADETPAVETVLKADKKRMKIEKRCKEIEDELDEGNIEHMDELEKLQMDLRMLGIDSAQAKARSILSGLGFSDEKMNNPTNSFSGGWRMRISLARALFMEPSVLLLDEPTNHLDLNAVIWLDGYLSRWKKTLLIVSHDQSFLDNICTNMIHLDNKKLFYYKGNYQSFQKTYLSKTKELLRQYEKQEKKLKESKNKGLSTKNAKSNLLKQNKNMGKSEATELIEKPKEYQVKFIFHPPAQLAGSVLGLFNVYFSYPNCEEIFSDISFGLDLTSRITLVGANGVGKSTFLKLLTGDLNPVLGDRQAHSQLIIGKYDQHSSDQLDLTFDATSYLTNKYSLHQQDVRKMLGQFGLESQAHLVEMKNLSGGQKARVAFVDAALKRPHILILDEPTNNLDLESIQALSDAIKIFKGGVIIVSHDERLIRETECILYEVADKKVKKVEGSFDDYRKEIISKYFEDEPEPSDDICSDISSDM